MKKLILTLALSIFLSGCFLFERGRTAFDASEFMPDRLYQSYDFDNDGNQMRVSAAFRIGGKCENSETELTKNVKFEGELLKSEPFNDPCNAIFASFHFTKIFPSSLESGVFSFGDSIGRNYSLKVEIPNASFGEFEKPIDHTKNLKIPIRNADKLSKGDWTFRIRSQSILALYGESKSKDFALSNDPGKPIYIDAKSNSIIVKREVWDDFHLGSMLYIQLLSNFPCNAGFVKPKEDGKGIECLYKTNELTINADKPISPEEAEKARKKAEEIFKQGREPANSQLANGMKNSNANINANANKAAKPKPPAANKPANKPSSNSAPANSAANSAPSPAANTVNITAANKP